MVPNSVSYCRAEPSKVLAAAPRPRKEGRFSCFYGCFKHRFMLLVSKRENFGGFFLLFIEFALCEFGRLCQNVKRCESTK